MADLTDNLVQEYEVIPANQDIGNRFDQDNFYPMDGDVEFFDNDEFSEARGRRKARRQARKTRRKAMTPVERKALRQKRIKKFGSGAKKVAGYYPPIAMANMAKKAYRKHKSKKEMENNSNFYGDEEHSELFGIKSKQKGGEGIWKGITNLVKTKDTQEGVNRLDERLKKRGEKAKYRADRRTLKRDARQARKLLRLPPEVEQETKSLGDASGVIKQAIIETSQGIAVPQLEQIADQTIAVATKLKQPNTNLDTDAVKTVVNEAQSSVQETTQALNEILDDNNPKGQKGWAGMSNGAKAGIIGGGVVVLGLIAFGIYKISKR